jgi:hypothetical protein
MCTVYHIYIYIYIEEYDSDQGRHQVHGWGWVGGRMSPQKF